jgi:hypothetical protein
MKVAKLLYKNGKWESERNDKGVDYQNAVLVLGYGARNILEDPAFFLK